jgi:hypothetical protein
MVVVSPHREIGFWVETTHTSIKNSIKFDKIQEELEELCGLDDLLTGVLSKSKGQILRLAACMNALFSLDPLHPLEAELSPMSIDASIDYVEVCNEHTSVMGGRKNTTSPLSRKSINPNSHSTVFICVCSHRGDKV